MCTFVYTHTYTASKLHFRYDHLLSSKWLCIKMTGSVASRNHLGRNEIHTSLILEKLFLSIFHRLAKYVYSHYHYNMFCFNKYFQISNSTFLLVSLPAGGNGLDFFCTQMQAFACFHKVTTLQRRITLELSYHCLLLLFVSGSIS